MASYTLTNLFSNSSFENTGWTANSACTVAYSNSIKRSGSYSLQVTSTSTSESLIVNSTSIALVQNHIYYCSAYIYETNSVCSMLQFYWPIAEPHWGDVFFDTTELNKWKKVSQRAIRSSWSSGNYQFRFDFEGMAANTVIYIDDALLIDLTATFGSGNEPSKEWCDAYIDYFDGSTTLDAKLPTTYDLTSAIPEASNIKTGDVINCPYSGTYKAITLPAGKYHLECWGAQGGSYSTTSTGGLGGYSTGIITLTNNTTLYLYSGGTGSYSTTAGSFVAGGFNGGGAAGYRYGASGGGGSDIRVGSSSLYARVIVAGGGGGGWGYSSYDGGYGGGTSGGQGSGYSTSYLAGVGTATAGGSGNGYSSSYYGSSGSFGSGGAGSTASSSYNRSSGGGGGWYGGGGSGYRSSSSYYYSGGGGAGGGSGYVYTSSTASNYPTGCLLNSSYLLIDASTRAGNSSFVDYSGSTVTGHSGNGACRITCVSVDTLTKIYTKPNLALPSGYARLDYIESNGAQRFDTGFTPNGNSRLKIRFELCSTTSSTNQTVFCSRSVVSSSDTVSNTFFFIDNGTKLRRDYYGQSSSITYSASANSFYELDCNKNATYLNGEKLHDDFTLSTNSSPCSWQLLGSFIYSNDAYSSYSNYASMRIFNCQIYDDSALVRNYVPAIDSSGNKGLYDTVNNTFAYNSSFTSNNETLSWKKNRNIKIRQNSLPSGYTELEYLQSSGTQYINTNFTPNQDTRVVCVAQALNATIDSYALFGARYSTSAQRYEFVNNASLFYSPYNTAAGTSSSSIASKITIDKNKNTTYLNNSLFATQTYTTFSCATSMILFGSLLNGTASLLSTSRIYNCKIYDNDTLVRHFIPCQNSSGILGMYDVVNDVFYTNAGSGTFVAGPEKVWKPAKNVYIKNPNLYTQLNYLQTVTTGYVNTGIYPNQNTKIILNTDILSSNSGSSLNLFIIAVEDSSAYFKFRVNSSQTDFAYRFGTMSLTNCSYNGTLWTQHKFEFGNGAVYIDDSLMSSYTNSNFQLKQPLYINKSNNSGTAGSGGGVVQNIYSCKIYDGSTLVRDFIPVKRNFDGVIGLMDTVNGIFYGNEGTGSFTAGSETNVYTGWIKI